jgi:hypothetical protein
MGQRFKPGRTPAEDDPKPGWPSPSTDDDHIVLLDASAHTALLVREHLAKHKTAVVPQPPHCPDLAPADISLFPELKFTLRSPISDERGDRRKIATGLTPYPTKRARQLEESLEAVYRQDKGEH